MMRFEISRTTAPGTSTVEDIADGTALWWRSWSAGAPLVLRFAGDGPDIEASDAHVGDMVEIYDRSDGRQLTPIAMRPANIGDIRAAWDANGAYPIVATISGSTFALSVWVR